MTSTMALRSLETYVAPQGFSLSLADGLIQGAEYFHSKIYVTPSRASKSAIKAIEANGGTVVCKYYNPLALRECVKGRTDRTEAAPTRRQDISKHCRLFRCLVGAHCLFSVVQYLS